MADIDGVLIQVESIAGNRLATNAAIPRSKLAQVPNSILRIPLFAWRVWNSGALLGTPANDDLGLAFGTLGTDSTKISAGDLKAAGATTRYALMQIPLPENYDPGETVTLRIRAAMETTVADGSCTIDAEVYEVGDDGTIVDSADICTTALQSMNSETPADYDFTITPDDLVAGDILEVRIAITCTDTATVTAVTPVIYKTALLYDARG